MIFTMETNQLKAYFD